MFRYIKQGYLKGLGIIRLGNRELFNLTGTYDHTQFELGMNINFTKDCLIHVGLTIGKVTVYIQILGKQFYK